LIRIMGKARAPGHSGVNTRKHCEAPDMVILVTDTGFHPDDWRDGFVPLVAVSDLAGAIPGLLAIDLPDADCTNVDRARLKSLLPRTTLIRIHLRHIGDTDAYALAMALRRAGFGGRLRAHGAVLAAHYTLARRAGFSEIALLAHQAQRQPCEHWRNNALWSPAARGAARDGRRDL